MDQADRVLELKNITKTFPGVLALDNISFSIGRGEVHGLVGENGAGKSTLIKILCGVYHPDGGEILVNGDKITMTAPGDAQKTGIQVMHQEISILPNMTVAENIMMYRLPRKLGFWTDEKEMNRQTAKLLELLDLDHLYPEKRMGELSLAEQQMINLARIVSTNASVVLLDEPTASLTMNEVKKLMDVIRRFKEMGVSIVYISHYIDEVLNICDRITILRDGRYIKTVRSRDVSNEDVVTEMVGKTVKIENRKAEKHGEEILRLIDVSTAKIIKHVNLTLNQKEVMGLYGLNGAGKTETLRAIAGHDKLLTGKISFRSEDISRLGPGGRIEKGLIYAPEDRRRQGLIMQMSVGQNASLGNEKKYARGGIINEKHEKKDVLVYVDRMRVKTPSLQTQVNVLSGGNQQKVILSRSMARKAQIFLMDEPTVGIDVGVREEIYELISSIVKADAAVLIASSDMKEILKVCDRIAIIANGRIVAVMNKDEAEEEKMLLYAMGDEKIG
jgi:ABC-type sugar transport system ATPase subunit